MSEHPIQILELIIKYTPTETLYDKCLIDKTWYKLVRIELYNRWRQCITEYENKKLIYKKIIDKWGEATNTVKMDELYNESQEIYSELRGKLCERINIEEEMYIYGMITDEQERKTVEYDIKIGRYINDPWEIEWGWGEEKMPEYYTWDQ